MRSSQRATSFLLCLLFNLLLNLDRSVPAWVLLALHFVLGWSMLWFWLALGLWLLAVVGWTCFMGFAARNSNAPKPYRENKNPYSVKTEDILPKREQNKE